MHAISHSLALISDRVFDESVTARSYSKTEDRWNKRSKNQRTSMIPNFSKFQFGAEVHASFYLLVYE